MQKYNGYWDYHFDFWFRLTAEILVKTITSEPDVTQICSSSTSDIITLIVCKIRTEKREECRLLYRYGWDFEHQCDSRFRLMMKNQTVFLRLTNLTPVDSGIYTCECSQPSGTYILNLNVTVEGMFDFLTFLICTFLSNFNFIYGKSLTLWRIFFAAIF